MCVGYCVGRTGDIRGRCYINRDYFYLCRCKENTMYWTMENTEETSNILYNLMEKYKKREIDDTKTKRLLRNAVQKYWREMGLKRCFFKRLKENDCENFYNDLFVEFYKEIEDEMQDDE